MKVSGKMDLKKDKGFGKEFSATRTSVNGRRAKQMVMACTSGRMETDTKASGSFVSNMAKALICLQTETPILANILTESPVVLVNTNGKIRPFMLVSLKME